MAVQPVFERGFPSDRPLSWEDLQGIPDDRYAGHEIVEGKLIVSPVPDSRHQSCVGSLAALLKAACPPDLKVFLAPYDYVPRPGYSLQPDVLVARRSEVGAQRLEHPPVLVVEVTSASSRATDRSLKRLVYEEHGVPHYWLVDPDGPCIVALSLQAGQYVEVGSAIGSQEWRATEPFPVAVVPSELLDE
ncbi:Uma2 family endonuclease [Quadrisphaera sp. GCM10027208]|uniref:Uma2 family endonuclease n=1 Tax=Quadrisphaera sp. GCM10027208 TaxID=3273423 RepID=UPI00361595E8